MGDRKRNKRTSLRLSFWLYATVAFACVSYIEQVSSLPASDDIENWPTFPRRNIAALARGGYLRSSLNTLKRSISTLAKNGQLPTFKAPYDSDDQQGESDDSHEKRNIGSIARMGGYRWLKRNVQTLARDGHRMGRNPNEKRNIAALARDGMIHKKDSNVEYYYPFFQNPVGPLSQFDANEENDMIANDKRLYPYIYGYPYDYAWSNYEIDDEPPIEASKRYIMNIPDDIEVNDLPSNEEADDKDKRSVEDMEGNDVIDMFEKRHIGSLARLGLLPSFRFSGGRYSRSGRARLLLPSHELYRKHSPNENFGIRQYISSSEVDTAANKDDTDLSQTAVPSFSHPTGRLLQRPLSDHSSQPLPLPPLAITNYIDSIPKNRWQKDTPKFYHFRSLKVPYQHSSKRYLVLPALDNLMLRKNYPNSSLPGRRKNQ